MADTQQVRTHIPPAIYSAPLHLAAWMAIGVLFALQGYSNELLNRGSSDFLALLRVDLIRWGAWGIVSPFVFAFGRAVAGERVTPRAVMILLAVAPVAVVMRTTIAVGFGSWVFEPTAGETFLAALERALRGRFALDLFIYGGLVAVFAALSHQRRAKEQQLLTVRLEAQLARARLEALEAHLQPHFLFNMLHSISALLDDDIRLARRMIVRFSELLRMTLDARDTPEVQLGWELTFAERYLEIQKTRFPDRLNYTIEADAEVRAAAVPRLLLQPIVENAIRHGVEKSAEPVELTIIARADGKQLQLTVENTGPALDEESVNRNPSGIGLQTTTARLQEAYGKNASLTITNRPGGGVTVRITLPGS